MNLYYFYLLITTCLLLLGVISYATLLVYHYDCKSWKIKYKHTIMYIAMLCLVALLTITLVSLCYINQFVNFIFVIMCLLCSILLIPLLLSYYRKKIYKQSLCLFFLSVIEYVILIVVC